MPLPAAFLFDTLTKLETGTTGCKNTEPRYCMDHPSQNSADSYKANLRRGRLVLISLIVIMLAAIILAALVSHLQTDGASNPSTVDLLPAHAPTQGPAPAGNLPPIGETNLLANWTGTARATYHIDARVLSTHRYYFDLYARFSPVDFALAWGRMANPQVDDWIQWRQRNRWYYYQIPTGSPYTLADIRIQSANVHIIPATRTLQRALLDVEEGDIIRLEGFLMDVSVDLLGWSFETATSLSREDDGAGACEILYVERLIRNGVEYR